MKDALSSSDDGVKVKSWQYVSPIDPSCYIIHSLRYVIATWQLSNKAGLRFFFFSW